MKKEIILSRLLSFSLIVTLLFLGACRADDLDLEEEEEEEDIIIIDLPDWTEETHGIRSNPDYQVVFDHGEVIRFDIVIEPADWTIMQYDLDANLGSGGGGQGGGRPIPGATTDYTPIWVPCTVLFNDTEWYKVGIRYKGNSSLQSSYSSGIEKLSFKLDFDEYENDYPEITDQRFYGFRQLNLKNNYDDMSLVREKVGADLFREFGLASSKTAFCVVYVDHGSGPIYFGVYTLVEEVDDSVLDSQFESGMGNLYKPDGTAASFAAGSYNESEMEKKNNETLADYSDVYALYNTINGSERTSNMESWKTELNACFDVDAFLLWLAANTAMQNWDTYGVMTHNYYLYNNPDNGLLTWIPWDNNEAFQEGKQGGALSLSLGAVSNNWPLIRYVMNVDEYQQIYKDYLLDFIEDAFAPEKMTALYSQYQAILQEYAYAENSPYTFIRSNASFDAAIQTLKDHAQSRSNAVQSYLQ